MNKLFISLAGAVMLGAALPTWAGPDWQAIEKARKTKQEAAVARHGDPHEAEAPMAASVKCPPEAPTLVLDHGPRAQTTPQQNRARQERHEAAVKACQAADK